MTSQERYLQASFDQARQLTQSFSTSFGWSITLIDKELRPAIYAIYGMVRLADEIVDTHFPDEEPEAELKRFEAELWRAIEKKYSRDPILHAFQHVYHAYSLRRETVEWFISSMAMDLEPVVYDEKLYRQYIRGSAEAVGLMCLSVFGRGNQDFYTKNEKGAQALGSAFQKVNFLRDMGDDFHERGRTYFPGVKPGGLTVLQKRAIEDDVETEYAAARSYVRALPPEARRGVALALAYYEELLDEIRPLSPEELMRKRVSVPNGRKLALYLRARMLG
ncbi:MAG: phytoene/squalene synthase family protein [bacterium]